MVDGFLRLIGGQSGPKGRSLISLKPALSLPALDAMLQEGLGGRICPLQRLPKAAGNRAPVHEAIDHFGHASPDSGLTILLGRYCCLGHQGV